MSRTVLREAQGEIPWAYSPKVKQVRCKDSSLPDRLTGPCLSARTVNARRIAIQKQAELASTNRQIASKLNLSASCTPMFNLQHAELFRLILCWKRVLWPLRGPGCDNQEMRRYHILQDSVR